jgi:hypothetical protein
VGGGGAGTNQERETLMGWADLDDASAYWPESDALDPDLLTRLLDVVHPACEVFAPALPAGAPVPEHYRAAQVRAAREWWSDRVSISPDGDMFESPMTVTALSPKVRQTLRPTRPAVAR